MVPDSPEKVEKVKKSLFSDDTDVISESDEGDSTLQYASKVTTKKAKKFKFKTFSEKKVDNSPGSLPSIPRGSPIIISSDEDLEKSMVEMEMQVSLETESD